MGRKIENCFHPDKYKFLFVTRIKNPMTFNNNLHGHHPESLAEAKYLSVAIRQDTKWKNHANKVCTKANKVFGFLRRNFNISSISETIYKTLPVLIRPLFE